MTVVCCLLSICLLNIITTQLSPIQTATGLLSCVCSLMIHGDGDVDVLCLQTQIYNYSIEAVGLQC